MAVLLPQIGVSSCLRAEALLEEHPQNIVGSFWVMCGYGFDEQKNPDWWIDIVLEENQAQGIINAFEEGYFEGGHDNPLYLGFCIIVSTDPTNPINLSYVIQHLRMWEYEGIGLLRLMARHNIPAHTEVSYPEDFLRYRYKSNSVLYNHLRESLNHWSTQVWEDYCSYLMSQHGRRMLFNFIKKTNLFKDEVKAAVEGSSKPLVLTEGETDPIYIKTALELLGEKDILEQVDIEWVGASIAKGHSINAGDSGLTNTRDVLLANPQFLTRRILLLYDCDAKKAEEDHENLKIRKIPQQDNTKVRKGIENLFPEILFLRDFYETKIRLGDYGEENQIQEFQKMKFCKWICQDRRKASDFVNFKIIANIIKDCLGAVVF